MLRTELYACAVALALAGCMKIYPDPELPDIDVTWFDGDCGDATFQIAMSLSSLDNPSSPHVNKTVPCVPAMYSFVDVARERFRLDGTLLDGSGASVASEEGGTLDLRNGFDTEAFLYFGSVDNFQVAWTFDGTSCAALGADTVAIVFTMPGQLPSYLIARPCELGFLVGTVPQGAYAIHAEARANDTVVAVSPETPELVILPKGGLTDAGTLVLTPCGAMCP